MVANYFYLFRRKPIIRA